MGILKKGQSGPSVADLQNIFRELGYSIPVTAVLIRQLIKQLEIFNAVTSASTILLLK
jgi:hypothetical protein